MSSVHVYSKNQCQRCNAVKRWLAQHDIPFTETNLDLISEAEADEIIDMIRKEGYLEAPVTYYSDAKKGIQTSFSGFNPIALEAIALNFTKEAA